MDSFLLALSLFLTGAKDRCDIYRKACTPEILKTLESKDATYYIVGLHEPLDRVQGLQEDFINSKMPNDLNAYFQSCTNPDFRRRAEAYLIKQQLASPKPMPHSALTLRVVEEEEHSDFQEMLKVFFEELGLKDAVRRATEFKGADRDIFDQLQGRIFLSLPKFSQKRFEFLRKYRGGSKTKPHLRGQCMEAMSVMFPGEVSSYVVDRLPWKKFESRTRSLFSNLKSEYLKVISDEKLGAAEKKKIRTALEKTSLIIGSKVSSGRRQGQKEITPETFFAFSQDDLPAEYPLMTNAFYDSQKNAVYLPAALLQSPLIDEKQDLGIRFILAHELFHAVRLADVKNPYFLSKEREWANYFLVHGYPASASEEVLADEWGLKIAFATSQMKKEDFLLSWGKLWCAMIRPEAVTYLKKNFVYPLGKDRVNAVACKL